jgi:prepilin-type N-terminal cleavage/methylation domain-containing protein
MEIIKEEMKMKKDGFTLIELIIVIVVIGIITAIALPTIHRTMQGRKGIMEGKAMIQNAVLGAKSLAASGVDDWQLTFDATTSPPTIAWQQSDSAFIWRLDSLPRGCDYATGGLILTFEFYRDGSAASLDMGGIDTFSIVSPKNERVLFTLIPQIGEVRADAR